MQLCFSKKKKKNRAPLLPAYPFVILFTRSDGRGQREAVSAAGRPPLRRLRLHRRLDASNPPPRPVAAPANLHSFPFSLLPPILEFSENTRPNRRRTGPNRSTNCWMEAQMDSSKRRIKSTRSFQWREEDMGNRCNTCVRRTAVGGAEEVRARRSREGRRGSRPEMEASPCFRPCLHTLTALLASSRAEATRRTGGGGDIDRETERDGSACGGKRRKGEKNKEKIIKGKVKWKKENKKWRKKKWTR